MRNTKLDVLKSTWGEIRVHLQTEEERISNEIDSYPTPIAGCDQQFNYLLEQRDCLPAERNRLHEKEAESLRAEDPFAILDQFIRSCRYIDAEAKASIRSRLESEHSNSSA